MRIEDIEEIELAGQTLAYVQEWLTQDKLIKDITKYLANLSFYKLMNTDFPIDVKLAILWMQNNIQEYNNSLLRKPYENV